MESSLQSINTAARMSLYDHLGYLFVGAYQILIILFVYCTSWSDSFSPIKRLFDLENILLAFVASYLIGHIIHAISNLIDVKEKEIKQKQDALSESIINKGRAYFGIKENINDYLVFQYVYLFASLEDKTGQIYLFNAFYGFYRGLLFSSVISLIGISIMNILVFILICLKITLKGNFSAINTIVFVSIMVFMILIWNKRRERFGQYFRDKTLILFDILTKESK